MILPHRLRGEQQRPVSSQSPLWALGKLELLWNAAGHQWAPQVRMGTGQGPLGGRNRLFLS